MAKVRKILVVDDDLDYCFILERDLVPAGFEVTTLRSGEDVPAAAERERPDVILLDVGLPGKSGWEVLADLQASLKTASIPVVMLTGHDDSDDFIRGYSSGAAYFIAKPHQTDELLRGIGIAMAPEGRSAGEQED